MPKTTDPSIVKVGAGSSSCNDKAKGNSTTQILMPQDAYDASQISAENPFETYLGDEAQSHFDDLASQVRHKPPRLGEGSKSYSFDSLSANHSGNPDWGMLKQADSKIWDRKSTITLDGITITDTSSHFKLSASETFGYNLKTPTPSGTANDGSDARTDSVFNVLDATPILLGGGEGASFICSVQKDSGRVHQHGRVIPRDDANLTELASAKEGFTVSSLLFPADRGTVALLRWEDGGTTNLSYTSASSVSDIKSRVVAAINLNGGLNETDVSIFTAGTDQSAFPSKLTGQYDLYEIQTGKKRADLASGGTNIASLQANKNKNLGSVRLLREANAAYFGDGVTTVDSTKGQLPVLGGAYSWDGSAWVETITNFLSYRLPDLADYSPSGVKTPTSERERFFSVVQPASTTTDFDTAGNYITFGDDFYTFQVARFRHVVDYSLLEPTINDSTGRKKGSYALVHFKTEDAIESLVRDGIQPTEDDLWTVNFINALEVEHIDNVAVDADGYSDKGVPQVEPALDSISNPLVRPNIHVTERGVNRWIFSSEELGFGVAHPTPVASGDRVIKRERGYFTVISGVKYLLPRGSVAVKHQSTNVYPTVKNNIAFTLTLNAVSTDPSIYNFTYPHYLDSDEGTSPIRTFSEPFDIHQINLGAITASNTLTVYSQLGLGTLGTKTTTDQFITIKVEDKTNATHSTNIRSDSFGVDLLIYPNGDTGICSFSEGALAGISVKDPTYHYDGLGTSKVLKPTATGGENVTVSKKCLYHSSKLHSLIVSASTTTVRVYFDHPASTNATGKFFSVFRYDQEGFRIYQTLENLTGNIQEVSSEHSNDTTYGTNYPKYGTTSANGNTSVALSPEATLEMVIDEHYFVEYGPGCSSLTDFFVVFIADKDATDAGSEASALSAKKVAQGNTNAYVTNWDRLSSGTTYGLNRISVNLLQNTTRNNTLPYPAFQPAAFNLNSYDLHEVLKTGEIAPEYGNLLQGRSGVISVQGLATDTTPLTFMNAYDPATVPLTRRAFSGLFTARKDTQERFLDESYRIEYRFTDITGVNNLIGPGLPDGSNALEGFWVRDDSAWNMTGTNSVHGSAGFLRNGHHWDWSIYSGVNGVEGNAQVRGMPVLSDNVLSGGKYGQPRRGVLTRPTENYQTAGAFVPNNDYSSTWDQSSSVLSYTAGSANKYYKQPNNSTTGTWNDRPFSYVRAFDVSFSQSGTVESMEGTSRFKMRLVGLEYDNFKYTGGDRRVEIYVKVPGLTTWLDVGRTDGEGASKQSTTVDGAGCLVSYQQGMLLEEAVYFTDLELEVGSNASFFLDTVYNNCPVLVKVVIPFNVDAIDGTLTFGLPPSNMATNKPLRERRGLVGIEILRMSNGKNFDEDSVVFF